MACSFAPDSGPFGAGASLPYGRGGRWLQRSPDPHHPRRRLALLLHQLPLRAQPAAPPSEEGVCGEDELQGRRRPRQGPLHTGEHAEAGPEAELYPRQLHGGGRSGLSRRTGHVLLCQGKKTSLKFPANSAVEPVGPRTFPAATALTPCSPLSSPPGYSHARRAVHVC